MAWTIRYGTEALDTLAWVREHAAEMRVPLLMIHGEADRLTAASGSRWFFERVTFPDKELRLYPGCYHELHNDLDHEQVLRDVESWLARHL